MVSQGRTLSLTAADFIKGGCRGPDSRVMKSRAGSQENSRINSFWINYLQSEPLIYLPVNWSEVAVFKLQASRPRCAIKIKPRKQTSGLSVSSPSSCNCPFRTKQAKKKKREQRSNTAVVSTNMNSLFLKCPFGYIAALIFLWMRWSHLTPMADYQILNNWSNE